MKPTGGGALPSTARCSYGLHFNGPCLAIDTGDSSGLIASDMAAFWTRVLILQGSSCVLMYMIFKEHNQFLVRVHNKMQQQKSTQQYVRKNNNTQQYDTILINS